MVFAIRDFNDKAVYVKKISSQDRTKKRSRRKEVEVDQFADGKGILVDTAEEINNSPTAISNGFISGLTRAKILREEETSSHILRCLSEDRCGQKSCK